MYYIKKADLKVRIGTKIIFCPQYIKYYQTIQ